MKTLDFIFQALVGSVFYLAYALLHGFVFVPLEVVRRLLHAVLCRSRAGANAMPPHTSVLITGGASGLGLEFALQYAAQPSVRAIFLTDLSEAALAAAKAAVTAAGGGRVAVTTAVVDATDATAMASFIAASDAATPLSLVIACAGVSEAISGLGERGMRTTVAVNVNGVVNTVLPALAAMTPRGAGQIALISSMSSYLGFWPSNAASTYAATKGWVRMWGAGLRGQVWNSGVRINTIIPGWVDTPLVRNSVAAIRPPGAGFDPSYTPFIVKPAEAVAAFVSGLAHDEALIIFPTSTYLMASFLHCLPPLLYDHVNRAVAWGNGRLGLAGAGKDKGGKTA